MSSQTVLSPPPTLPLHSSELTSVPCNKFEREKNILCKLMVWSAQIVTYYPSDLCNWAHSPSKLTCTTYVGQNNKKIFSAGQYIFAHKSRLSSPWKFSNRLLTYSPPHKQFLALQKPTVYSLAVLHTRVGRLSFCSEIHHVAWDRVMLEYSSLQIFA